MKMAVREMSRNSHRPVVHIINNALATLLSLVISFMV